MEKRESKNVFDMMFRSTRERNGSTFWTACAGMLITLLPYFALALLSYLLRDKVEWMWIVAVCIGALLLGPLQYGYIRFYNKLTKEGNANIFSIYDFWHMENFIMILFGGLLEAVVIIVLAAFILVPVLVLNNTIGAIVAGVVAASILVVLVAFFSMVFFFIDHHKYEGFAEALKNCFIRMRRNRMSMMSYKVLYYVFFLLIALVSLIAGYKISTLFGTEAEVYGLILAIIGMALLFTVVAYIMTWYHATNHLYFEQILDYHEKKSGKKEEVQAEEEVQEVVEEKAVEEEAPAIVAPGKIVAPQKAAAKKTATAKNAPAKKTSTAKKVAAPKKAEVKEEVAIEAPVAPAKIEAPKKATTTKKVATTKAPAKATKPAAAKAAPAKIEPPKKATTKKASSIEPPKKATKTTKTTK